MVTIENGKFIDLQVTDALDNAVSIYQGRSMDTPEITIDVDAIPKLRKVLKQIYDQQKEVKQ